LHGGIKGLIDQMKIGVEYDQGKYDREDEAKQEDQRPLESGGYEVFGFAL
tara:strand:- start:114 stop:263 length:150 start_codon:yes stop_codon:yes gene_type:complete